MNKNVRIEVVWGESVDGNMYISFIFNHYYYSYFYRANKIAFCLFYFSHVVWTTNRIRHLTNSFTYRCQIYLYTKTLKYAMTVYIFATSRTTEYFVWMMMMAMTAIFTTTTLSH